MVNYVNTFNRLFLTIVRTFPQLLVSRVCIINYMSDQTTEVVTEPTEVTTNKYSGRVRRLTAKEKGYIKSIASGKTRRDAVRENYDVKPDVSVKTLDSMADSIEKREGVMALLKKHESAAQQTVIDVMTYAGEYGRSGDKEGALYARIALDGANSLLDRVHGKATQQIQLEAKVVSMNIDLTGELGNTQ